MFNNIFYFLIPKKNRRKVEATVKDMCRFIRQLNDRRYHIIDNLKGTRGNCDYVDDYLIVKITLTLHNSEFYIHTSYDKRFKHEYHDDDKFSFIIVGSGNSLRLFFYILCKKIHIDKHRDFMKYVLDDYLKSSSIVGLHGCVFSFYVVNYLDDDIDDDCAICRISDNYYLIAKRIKYIDFDTELCDNKYADEFLNYLKFLSLSFNPFYSEIVKLIDREVAKKGKLDFINRGI